MRFEQLKNGKGGFKKGSNSLNDKEVPNNLCKGWTYIIVAK